MKILKLLASIAFGFSLISAFAQSSAQQFPPNNGIKIPEGLLNGNGQSSIRNQIDKIKATKRLPIYGMNMIETTDGKVVLVSDNGRFAVIGGRWVDVWEGSTITNIADSATLDKVNLGRMGLNVDEFDPFVIGNGSKIINVFVDPMSEESRAVVRQMAALGKEYTFKVILLPLKGQQSGQAARRLICSPDKKLALDAFMNGVYSSIPEPTNSCNVIAVQKAMITSQVLSITNTPYIILPNNYTVTVNSTQVNLSEILARK
jgi:thiol:disulfide interchange protein DsbC